MLLQQDSDEREKRSTLLKDLAKYWTAQQHEDAQDAGIKCDQKGAFKIPVSEAALGPSSMQVFQVGSA